jgi:serine/threonine-protein kinase
MALNVGDVVDDKYRIVRLLGEGGMGAVYEGENTRIHRRVAIKVLHQGVAQTADAVQRFEREAQAAGRIGNEHIVEVLDLGTLPAGDHYMVMEYLDGESLADRIKNGGAMSPQELLPVAVQMLEGLKAAHHVGIIHRDLKPDNVFLTKAKGGVFAKLVDFGISKFNTMGGEFSMTRTGAVMGTPYYMSPEQAKGQRDIDQRVDLYAAGVILYEAVTGSVPFDAETFNELLFKIVLEEPPPVLQARPDLDPAFATIVDKARAKDANARFQTAAEFQDALKAWASGARVEFSAAQTIMTPASGVSPSLGTVTPDTWSNDDIPGGPKKNNKGSSDV